MMKLHNSAFTQWWNCTIHFSEYIPIVKWYVTVYFSTKLCYSSTNICCVAFKLHKNFFLKYEWTNKHLFYLQSTITLSFSKLFFIDYAITVVPIFPLLSLSTQHPSFPQAIPTPLFVSMGHSYKFFGYSISYTVPYSPLA